MPFYLFTDPGAARTLLAYRGKSLPGARKKAQENGYEGAMFPWESAWLDDGEVTPLWGAADIVTGESIPILTGKIEQHISADISYA
ncbi:MAG: family 65 glycosyl hydrolase, partial [Waltera sp.]